VSDGDGFVDALIAAPVGAALLALVEGTVRSDLPWWELPSDSDPDDVRLAADQVRTWSFGALATAAVSASYLHTGPWMSSAPAVAATAYRHAEARRAIADAIASSFGVALHRPVDLDAQEWWHSRVGSSALVNQPRFRSFEDVYGAGQFTWGGLWTVTGPPPEVHADLIGAWELDPDPVSRWRLPVSAHARVYEIHRPEDWVNLVAGHPAVARGGAEGWEGWELPGPNQRPKELASLLAHPDQRAARTAIRRHLVPDWRGVAADYDGVHLSWAGFLTSEGCVTDVGDGDVVMLRYWFSERTHWLADVFGEPEPLDAPYFDPDQTTLTTVDVRTDAVRRHDDERVLAGQLGR
jgi:hypothetical protein